MIPVAILCGGSGTRLREQTEFIPKPLIPIGGIPMVVHIMRHYAHYGFKKFVLALGYKQDAFKEYFVNYDAINNDITVDIGRYRGVSFSDTQDWGMSVTLADTGMNTLKGGRLKRIERYIQGDTFMLCYGDGVSDINIPALLEFHKSHGKLATVTGVHAIPRFGEVHHKDDCVLSFSEKPLRDDCLINGGYYIFNRGIFDYLVEEEYCDLEVGTLDLIAAKGEMMVYKHTGYWACMDSLKDMDNLQNEWASGKARWKI